MSRHDAKQKRIAATLLNGALHQLGELDVPYVLILQGCEQIFTNTNSRLATAILEDAASYSATLREKMIEAKVESIIDKTDWGGDKA